VSSILDGFDSDAGETEGKAMMPNEPLWSAEVSAEFIDITTLADLARLGWNPPDRDTPLPDHLRTWTRGIVTISKDGEEIVFDQVKSEIWQLLQRGKEYKLLLIEQEERT
jgi:hypothetical protein